MKKSRLVFACAAVLSASVLFSSCVGSFALSNKVLNWNKSLGNKFVNEIVFLCFNILPVYEFSMFADGVVLNTIEFWTGSNPVAFNGVQHIKGDNANYTIQSSKNGYVITNDQTKETAVLSFNKNDNSWSASENGKTVKFMSFVDNNHVRMYNANGTSTVVELSQAGVTAYQNVINNNTAVAFAE